MAAQKFCVELDSETLEKAKTEAVKRGVETSIAGKTGPFLRYLLESYINAIKTTINAYLCSFRSDRAFVII